MSALGKMTASETRLFLRDPGAPITVVGIPVALLLVFSLIPGANEPNAEFGGNSVMANLIAPLAVAILLGMLALTIFPAFMATYREKGVLRRLSASPVSPSTLLLAQLIVNLVAALVVVLLVVVIGTAVIGMEAPANPLGLTVSIVLGTAALFAMGLLIAAVAPTGRAAGAIGSAAFFPMLALGGVWVPKEHLPSFFQGVADVLPMGATYNALRETWAGGDPQLLQLGSLVVFTVVCLVLAARLFRWQ
ncbi:ABC transporter permease [Prauserella flavalba]|uniref:Transport permease protein n=1 Tax=Prauserella flavalba TaxID=1477506 RepID=A0A318LKC9_9PSEU|nr:ABC transporter permease [Prauserella flavalba]PXY28553.1 multidrug ABC transporter permease [Prauserella flavalba]